MSDPIMAGLFSFRHKSRVKRAWLPRIERDHSCWPKQTTYQWLFVWVSHHWFPV